MLLIPELVALLIVANGAPLVLSRILGTRGYPVDCRLQLPDGRRLFGASKTWRGLAVAIVAAAVVAWLFRLGFIFGAVFGAVAMLGDLLSSFVKRRFGLGAGDRARGLDQLPEGLLPNFVAWWWLGVSGWVALLAALIFCVLNIWGSPLLYRLGIRRRPH
ncbi:MULTISPECIES: CDP-archaeol synthase [Gammaproteobacteria]|uniref:CDP-archaeol synthase n=1 Tax=Vreelandella halophila TaxID=86177 RepID=A0A9X5B5G2_9GAMM|nr:MULTISPECIES: CDP-archaeol synthase [Gammaproteobacteria]KAA8983628.1 CDP-archaeol synthase [Halospina sp. K52047b]MYL27325.1 CDP-archaeol synthase [Halomonas utahensis]MYL76004.1 CDP-archaeol synthase [Halomonas sp. 22501_18_FS]